MSILVKDCFHWIGFHIVDYLLKETYEVKGIQTSSSQQSDHLSMFFDRHSHFSMKSDADNQNVHTTLLINSNEYESINTSRMIVIAEKPNLEMLEDHHIVIEQPLLFGEWMPIHDEGCYYLNEYVSFDSSTFHQQAIWIHDFTKMIATLLTKKDLPHVINVKKSQNKSSLGLRLDNTFYIRDNTPIESKVDEVLQHYKQFKHYY